MPSIIINKCPVIDYFSKIVLKEKSNDKNYAWHGDTLKHTPTDMQNTSKRKAGAEVLDIYYPLSQSYLCPFQLCFDHTMAVSW